MEVSFGTSIYLLYLYHMKIGIITQEQSMKAIRKGNRDAELEMTIGWSAKNKVHASMKSYSRKSKHKPKY